MCALVVKPLKFADFHMKYDGSCHAVLAFCWLPCFHMLNILLSICVFLIKLHGDEFGMPVVHIPLYSVGANGAVSMLGNKARNIQQEAITYSSPSAAMNYAPFPTCASTTSRPLIKPF